MKNQSGFTLFSLIITIVISGILTMLASGILHISLKSYQFFVIRSTMLRETQNTMVLLYEKIPRINPENIVKANSRRFRFLSDNGEDIDIRYNRRKDVLHYRVVGKTDWKILLNNIAKNSFSFSYSTIDGKSSKSVDEIRLVLLNFKLKIENEEMNYENKILIRN